MKCVFRGTDFPGCKFVECQFVNCEFAADDHGKRCSADGAHVYAAIDKGSRGGEFLLDKNVL